MCNNGAVYNGDANNGDAKFSRLSRASETTAIVTGCGREYKWILLFGPLRYSDHNSG
jgi:hypothetical protein